MDDVMKSALDLVERSRCVMVGSQGPDGYPNIKAMFNAEHEGLATFLLSTNTSSRRVMQFRDDSHACLYFVDPERVCGLMLIGDMDVLEDLESKQRLWQEGCERYYPQGVTDPDYCVLRFTARSANWYHGLKNTTFAIE